VVGVTNLAPTFGPIVGCVIGAFILVLINPVQALVFILFTILLQVLDGYIFKPRLFGATLGASPIWILIFIIVGGRIFGVWGILLAIPAASILGFVYNEMIVSRLEDRRKMRQDSDPEEESKSMIQSIRDGFSEMTDEIEEQESK
jgi:predicted PurR-regulated permease PerM